MCGIFGYTGYKNAASLLISGLKTLEYRGYDSAGVFFPGIGRLRAVGEVEHLKEKMNERFFSSSGIGHTRWATHGAPEERNAHPHTDCSGTLAIVHNGIIENYEVLKRKLIAQGHAFASDTDSEVLAHLIEEKRGIEPTLEGAVALALGSVTGTYGVAVVSEDEPDKIIIARSGSPLVIGIGERERFVASDPSAILQYTREVFYLNDGEYAVLLPSGHTIYTLAHQEVSRPSEMLAWEWEEVAKGGFAHFMEKEILEGPTVIRNALRGRLIKDEGRAQLGGLSEVAAQLQSAKRIRIIGCGSAYYAGLVGASMFEEYAGIEAHAELGSEFRYRSPVLAKDTVILAISQSGETADTLCAVREAKRRGLLTLGIVNVVGSSLARETDAGIYTHAGPEMGVASTKAFVSQLAALCLFTLFIGRQRDMGKATGVRIAEALFELPGKVQTILARRDQINAVALRYQQYRNFLYIGRKYQLPIAYEGALKLKEISYAHAEGYGAGEMKHGPIAMIDESFPTVAIALKDSVYEKTISAIKEIQARKGRVLGIGVEGDTYLSSLCDDVIFIPPTEELLAPILSTVALQLFAYAFAVAKGYNVDRPRNLAKSVTVE